MEKLIILYMILIKIGYFFHLSVDLVKKIKIKLAKK